jgi:NAD(P)H-dependent flavin oxidoreductase YrpB (nitropropane dioxygenase family)
VLFLFNFSFRTGCDAFSLCLLKFTVLVKTMFNKTFFGTELPIIQAPMAGVQDSALTIAVSNAGGLGSLPCAMLGPDALRAELKSIKSQTSKPFNLNFFVILLQNQILSAKQNGAKLCSPISKNMV